MSDPALQAWLDRCRELAEHSEQLDGIEAPAAELAALARGDRQLMERARRNLAAGLVQHPHDPTLRQMMDFWRRAFEKGSWSWAEDSARRNRYL